MIPTQRSDDISDLILFLDKILGYDSKHERRGAHPNDVQKLVGLITYKLPDIYIGYLYNFGLQDSVLKMAGDAETTLNELIEFYEQQALCGNQDIPHNGVVIATEGLSGGRALIYSESKDVEPIVVVNWSQDIGEICAQSFRNHLYHQAFIRGRLRAEFRQVAYGTDQSFFARIGSFALQVGFQSYWFSDDCQLCLERDDDVVINVRRTKDMIIAYIQARIEKECVDLKASLARELGMK